AALARDPLLEEHAGQAHAPTRNYHGDIDGEVQLVHVSRGARIAGVRCGARRLAQQQHCRDSARHSCPLVAHHRRGMMGPTSASTRGDIVTHCDLANSAYQIRMSRHGPVTWVLLAAVILPALARPASAFVTPCHQGITTDALDAGLWPLGAASPTLS